MANGRDGAPGSFGRPHMLSIRVKHRHPIHPYLQQKLQGAGGSLGPQVAFLGGPTAEQPGRSCALQWAELRDCPFYERGVRSSEGLDAQVF
jgi:hypothetical protein